jgi:hypothetical protein
MKIIKYEVRGVLVDVSQWPLQAKHHTFATFMSLDPDDALRAAIKKARLVETIGQRVEDLHTTHVRVVKITEEEVI